MLKRQRRIPHRTEGEAPLSLERSHAGGHASATCPPALPLFQHGRMSQRRAKQARQAERVAAEQAPRSAGRPARSVGSSPWRRPLIGGGAVLLVAAVIVAGVMRGGGSQAAAVGGSAPKLSGSDPITGSDLSLSDFDGKPVVINIWASWCPGCNDEATDLAIFARRHPETQVLGIDTQDVRGDARSFYQRWHWSHPSIFDPDGSLAAKLALQGLPTTIFLDAQHRIVTRIVGAGDLADFEGGLRQALAS